MAKPFVASRRLPDLDEHMAAVARELPDAPPVCLDLIRCIVKIRRKLDLEESAEEFRQLLRQDIRTFCTELDTRWLVAITDTLVDVGDATESRNAMLVSQLVNLVKLAETEKLLMKDAARDAAREEAFPDGFPYPLWDGTTSYNVFRGDMPGNMFNRMGRLLDATPAVRAIYDEILRELRASGTFIETFGRMNPRFWSGDGE